MNATSLDRQPGIRTSEVHFPIGQEPTTVTGFPAYRLRSYNPDNGRFNRLDPFVGNMRDPQSLHKYGYVHGDPISGIDPSGEVVFSLLGLLAASFIGRNAQSRYNTAVVKRGAVGLGVIADILTYRYALNYGGFVERDRTEYHVHVDVVRIVPDNPIPGSHFPWREEDIDQQMSDTILFWLAGCPDTHFVLDTMSELD